jgi:hypothetical protein
MDEVMDEVMDEQRSARLTHELGDHDLAGRLVRARREVVEAVPHDVARRHLTAILAACADHATRSDAMTTSTGFTARRQWGTTASATVVALPTRTFLGTVLERSAKLAVAATIVSLATIGGLAAAGSLPASAQNLVADAVSHVGVELPRPATPPPAGAPAGAPAGMSRGPGLGAREDGAAPGLRGQDEAPGVDRRRGAAVPEHDDRVTGADRRDEARDEDLRQRRREHGSSVDPTVGRGRSDQATAGRDGHTTGDDTGDPDQDAAPNIEPVPPPRADTPARPPDVGVPAADPRVPAGPDGERNTPPVANTPAADEADPAPGEHGRDRESRPDR